MAVSRSTALGAIQFAYTTLFQYYLASSIVRISTHFIDRRPSLPCMLGEITPEASKLRFSVFQHKRQLKPVLLARIQAYGLTMKTQIRRHRLTPRSCVRKRKVQVPCSESPVYGTFRFPASITHATPRLYCLERPTVRRWALTAAHRFRLVTEAYPRKPVFTSGFP